MVYVETDLSSVRNVGIMSNGAAVTMFSTEVLQSEYRMMVQGPGIETAFGEAWEEVHVNMYWLALAGSEASRLSCWALFKLERVDWKITSLETKKKKKK